MHLGTDVASRQAPTVSEMSPKVCKPDELQALVPQQPQPRTVGTLEDVFCVRVRSARSQKWT